MDPDVGERFLQPGTTVRYLPQEPNLSAFATVWDYIADGLAPGDNQQIRPGNSPKGCQCIKPINGRCNALGGSIPLHTRGPKEHVAGKPVAKPVQYIPDDRAGRRGHDADDPGVRLVGHWRLRVLPRSLLPDGHHQDAPGPVPGHLVHLIVEPGV